MLRVTIELFPGGHAGNSQILSQDHIVNDGTGTLELGNYYAEDSARKLKPIILKGYKRSKGHRLLVAKMLTLLDKESLR